MRGLMRGLFRFAFGLSIGAAVGAILGTLYAPESGDQLKRRVRERLQAARVAGDRAEREKVEQLRREYRLRVEHKS